MPEKYALLPERHNSGTLLLIIAHDDDKIVNKSLTCYEGRQRIKTQKKPGDKAQICKGKSVLL